MRVRAKEACFVDNFYRKEGDEFDFDGELHPFMEAVDEGVDEKPKSQTANRRKPISLSEIQKGENPLA